MKIISSCRLSEADREWEEIEREREVRRREAERARQEVETRRRIEARLKAKQEAAGRARKESTENGELEKQTETDRQWTKNIPSLPHSLIQLVDPIKYRWPLSSCS